MSFASDRKFIPFAFQSQVYWNNERIGSVKGDSGITLETETSFAGDGEHLGFTQYQLTAEGATVVIELGDWSLEQLRRVFARCKVGTNTLASATTSSNLRFDEDLQVGRRIILPWTTLGQTPRATADIVVTSVDYVTRYTEGTHYYFETSTLAIGQSNSIAWISASGPASGTWARLHYQYPDTTAEILRVGGAPDVFEGELKIVYRLAALNKILQVTFWKAVRAENIETLVPFKGEGAPITLSFRVLHDLTKPRGEQLFEWALEHA